MKKIGYQGQRSRGTASFIVFAQIACLAWSATALTAQAAVSAVTRKATKVRASANGRSGSKTIAANTDVTAGFFLSISKSGQNSSGGQCGGTAMVSLRKLSLSGHPKYEFENWATATPPFFCPSSASTDAHEILVTFYSNNPVAGRLLIDIKVAYQSGTQSKWTGSIDVGDDGKVELSAVGQRTIDAVVGPKGLRVVLRGSAIAQFGGVKCTVSAAFVPPTGSSRFKVIGVPCGGPVFEGLYTGQLLRLDASSIPAGKFGLIAFGTQNLNVKIPPFGCTLYTDILVGVGVTPTSGAARLTIPLTAPPPAGTFRMQFLTVSNGAWLTSNAISITLL